MMIHRFALPFACPVPIGHRIEVRHYARNTGVFSEEWTEDAQGLIVVDLDTGVHYLPDSLLGVSALDLTLDPTKLSPNARFLRASRGRVQATHVVTHVSGKYYCTMTVLIVLLEPGDGEAAYR